MVPVCDRPLGLFADESPNRLLAAQGHCGRTETCRRRGTAVGRRKRVAARAGSGRHRRHRGHQGINRVEPHGRILGQGSTDHVAQGRAQLFQVGLGRQVLHQHFADALALERHAAGEHFIEHDAQGVDVDFLAVAAVGDLGRHVVYGADALGLPAAAAAGDEFREAVIAELDNPFVAKHVARLEVAVDDAVAVQVRHPGRDAAEPIQGFGQRHALRIAADRVLERFAVDQLHDDPAVVLIVLADIVQGHQMGVLQVQAVRDAAELDVQVAADQLQGDFFAGIADGEIDLAESPAADAPLDRIALERPGAGGIEEAGLGPAQRRAGGAVSAPGPGSITSGDCSAVIVIAIRDSAAGRYVPARERTPILTRRPWERFRRARVDLRPDRLAFAGAWPILADRPQNVYGRSLQAPCHPTASSENENPWPATREPGTSAPRS